jgi:hypothetical protein
MTTMAGKGHEHMAGQEDVATQPGLPSAHENTAVIIEDHEANEQRLQSLMLPFACEDSATIGDHRATDQQKTQVDLSICLIIFC